LLFLKTGPPKISSVHKTPAIIIHHKTVEVTASNDLSSHLITTPCFQDDRLRHLIQSQNFPYHKNPPKQSVGGGSDIATFTARARKLLSKDP